MDEIKLIVGKNKQFYVDAGIYNACKLLVDNGIETLASCDGHGNLPPSILVDEKYSKEEIRDMLYDIKKVDERPFMINQWVKGILINFMFALDGRLVGLSQAWIDSLENEVSNE